jgi:hypothetical protein
MLFCHAFNSPQETEETDFWDHFIVETFDDGASLRNFIKTLMPPLEILLNFDPYANFRSHCVSKRIIIKVCDCDIKQSYLELGFKEYHNSAQIEIILSHSMNSYGGIIRRP